MGTLIPASVYTWTDQNPSGAWRNVLGSWRTMSEISGTASRNTSNPNPNTRGCGLSGRTYQEWIQPDALPATNEYSITVRPHFAPEGGGAAQYGLILGLRYDSANRDYYRAVINPDGSCRIDKLLDHATVGTAPGSGWSGTIGSREPINFKVIGNDPTTAELRINDVLLATYVDSGQDGPVITQKGSAFASAHATTTSAGFLDWELYDEASGPAPPLSVDPVPPQTITEGDPVTLNMVDHTNNGVPPYVYSLAGGTLPAGITLNAAGTFDGTADPGTQGSYFPEVNVVDQDGGDETFAAFLIDVLDPAVQACPPKFLGTNIPNFTLTRGVPEPDYDISIIWSGADSWGEVGTWPAGVTVDTVNGLIRFDENATVLGEDTINAKAIELGGQETLSNQFVIKVVDPAGSASVTTTPIDDGNGNLATGISMEWIYFPNGIEASVAAGDWIASTGAVVTDGQGSLTTPGVLPPGSGEILVYAPGYAHLESVVPV